MKGWAWRLLDPFQWRDARRYRRTYGLKSCTPAQIAGLRKRAAVTRPYRRTENGYERMPFGRCVGTLTCEHAPHVCGFTERTWCDGQSESVA